MTTGRVEMLRDYRDLIEQALEFIQRPDTGFKRRALTELVDKSIRRAFEGLQALGFYAVVPAGADYSIEVRPQVKWRGMELLVMERPDAFAIDDILVGNISSTPAATTVSALSYSDRNGSRHCNLDLPWADWDHPIKLRIRNVSPCTAEFKATMFGVVMKEPKFVVGGLPYFANIHGLMDIYVGDPMGDVVDERQLSLLGDTVMDIAGKAVKPEIAARRCYGCDKGSVSDGGRLCAECKKDSEKG
jgi:hypothetical protein